MRHNANKRYRPAIDGFQPCRDWERWLPGEDSNLEPSG